MKDNRLDIDLDGLEAKMNWGTNKTEDELIEASQELLERIEPMRKEANSGSLTDEREQELKTEMRQLQGKMYYREAKIIYDFEAMNNEMPDEEWFMRDDFPKRQHEYNRMVFSNPSILM